MLKSCYNPLRALQTLRSFTGQAYRLASTLTQEAQQQSQEQKQSVEEPVLIHEQGSARYITLNRPKALNAMTIGMVETFLPWLQAWEKSTDSKMVFMKGNGRAMCAGGDVKAAVGFIKQNDGSLIKVLDTEFKMFHYISTMKTPYIALLDGITMGAGAGLSINTPFRIATENTMFAMPETIIGLFPDVGATFYFPRLDGQIGTYLGMTGQAIKAHDVLQSGIATHFVPFAHLPALESKLISLDTSDHDTINEAINEFASQYADDQVMKNQHFTLCGETRQTIDRCFQYHTAEEIMNALEKDGSAFAKEARQIILKRCPTSVKVALQNLRLGVNMGIADCLKMEYDLWQKFSVRHDFIEGVTAQLVTRQPPQWKPASLTAIDNDELKRTFYDSPSTHPIDFLNDDNYLVHPYRHFALPSEKDILNTVSEHPTWTLNDVSQHFLDLQKGKYGILEKVADVWARKNVGA